MQTVLVQKEKIEIFSQEVDGKVREIQEQIDAKMSSSYENVRINMAKIERKLEQASDAFG
jgi:hypothetical protein